MDIKINIAAHEGDWEEIRYEGPINEDAEVHLQPLMQKVGKKCVINFHNVTQVNSCGVRAWINFFREFEKEREVAFEECNPEVVMQMNIIPSFKGNAEVRSVFGPYTCESCGHSERVLFEKGKNLPQTEEDYPEIECKKCGEIMEMDELEDEFFAFSQAS